MLREIDTLKDRDISALSAWMFLELCFGCRWGCGLFSCTCSVDEKKAGGDGAAGGHGRAPPGCPAHSLPLETPLLTNPASVTFLYWMEGKILLSKDAAEKIPEDRQTCHISRVPLSFSKLSLLSN